MIAKDRCKLALRSYQKKSFRFAWEAVTSLAIASLLVPVVAHSQPIEESNIMLSSKTLDAFIAVAECLSIRAPINEKKEFLTSRIMAQEWDVTSAEIKSQEWIMGFVEAEDSDRKEIFQAANKYCPTSVRRAVTRVELDGYGASTIPPAILAGIVIKFISLDVLGAYGIKGLFESENKAIAVDGVY
jgi:hypothetical protein